MLSTLGASGSVISGRAGPQDELETASSKVTAVKHLRITAQRGLEGDAEIGANTVSDFTDGARIARHDRIARQQRHSFTLRLGDEQPIKRVAV